MLRAVRDALIADARNQLKLMEEEYNNRLVEFSNISSKLQDLNNDKDVKRKLQLFTKENQKLINDIILLRRKLEDWLYVVEVED